MNRWHHETIEFLNGDDVIVFMHKMQWEICGDRWVDRVREGVWESAWIRVTLAVLPLLPLLLCFCYVYNTVNVYMMWMSVVSAVAAVVVVAMAVDDVSNDIYGPTLIRKWTKLYLHNTYTQIHLHSLNSLFFSYLLFVPPSPFVKHFYDW